MCAALIVAGVVLTLLSLDRRPIRAGVEESLQDIPISPACPQDASMA